MGLRASACLPAVACAALALSAAGAQPAAAVPSCWKQLIRDWRDAHISGSYPVSCYRQALARAPSDLRIYSTLEDDLRRALEVRLSRRLASRPPASPAAGGGAGSTFTLLASLSGGLAGAIVVAGIAAGAAGRRGRSLSGSRSRARTAAAAGRRRG